MVGTLVSSPGQAMGLLLVVVVHTDNIQDRDDARLGLAKLLGNFPRLQLIWADAGYSTESHERVRPAPLTADFDEPDQDANERAISPAGPGRFLCPAPCIVRAEPFWLRKWFPQCRQVLRPPAGHQQSRNRWRPNRRPTA